MRAARTGIHRSMIGALRNFGLTRATTGGIAGGVLAGLAQNFGGRARTLRIVFVISMILPGPQVLAYLVLWVLMPRATV